MMERQKEAMERQKEDLLRNEKANRRKTENAVLESLNKIEQVFLCFTRINLTIWPNRYFFTYDISVVV